MTNIIRKMNALKAISRAFHRNSDALVVVGFDGQTQKHSVIIIGDRDKCAKMLTAATMSNTPLFHVMARAMAQLMGMVDEKSSSSKQGEALTSAAEGGAGAPVMKPMKAEAGE
jgi:hypothetical protein